MAFLELTDITRDFTRKKGLFGSEVEVVKAVRGVTLSVEKGEILGLVGESGCGKSTLSRIIMQLLRPTSGEVSLQGESLAGLSPSAMRRRRIDFQMIFQDPYASLNPRMTIYTALAEAVRQRHTEIRGDELRERVSDLMGRVGLSPRFVRKYPHEFSGGQRQRVAIARALATEPKLILADEPVSALDVSIQSQILNLLQELSRDLELSMLFISHDLSVVHYLADRIAVMQEGRLVEVGTAEQVFRDPQHDYTKALLAAIPGRGGKAA
ncbi:MAG: ATP-binding cassette domain-containing protein [Verrucomicrobiota bacterium]